MAWPNAETGRLMMVATPSRFWADFADLIRLLDLLDEAAPAYADLARRW